MSIHLFSRVNRLQRFIRDLTPDIEGWVDQTAAIGGYMTAQFRIPGKWGHELNQFYDTMMGSVVRRVDYGMTRWEGIIYEMRMVLDGIQYERSMAPEVFQNKVQVFYSSDIGVRTETGWTENTDSSDEYGEMCYIDSVGGATAAGAAALVARRLKDFGWPRSRIVGAAPGVPDTLEVSCAGFWATLNWRYRETTLTDTASACVSTLVAASEFVTAGRVDTNALSIRLDCYPNPQRLGDLIEQVISQGDASGNVWQGGVYAGKLLHYEQAPTSAKYEWRGGKIYNRGGNLAAPELIDPGQLIVNTMAVGKHLPLGLSTGSYHSAWDDPAAAYIEQVEYSMEDDTMLTLAGGQMVAIVQEQIKSGNI